MISITNMPCLLAGSTPDGNQISFRHLSTSGEISLYIYPSTQHTTFQVIPQKDI